MIEPMTRDGTRVRRGPPAALVERLVGKKVLVSTTDDHFLVGQLVAADDDRLHLRVSGRPVEVRRAGVARVHEADPALAEYVK